MADIVLTLWETIGVVLASAGIPIGTIVYILFNLDKAEGLVAKFAKLFSYFSMRAEGSSRKDGWPDCIRNVGA